ncbi:Protein tyrosine phosphatase type IVA 1 [Entophlyctis luteolus]|nr:Protein tyrosine phosphatase type IVA 1 [Entophlyctis luteolus]KAJ3353150.1 Protein tyrosine phosphatase type IVA 1 [Entophlyctis luteolus]
MTSISRNNLHFVVFDAPSDSTLPLYLAELSARSVSHIVRVSEMPTYSAAAVADLAPSISVVDLPFPDGSVPPPHTITAFLDLCQSVFPGGLTNKQQICGDDITSPPQRAIGVHCIAGLGRAPMLVAIALIESGMSALEAVEYVRVRRRGAFNSVQLRFLVDEYKPSYAKNLARKNLLLSSFSFGVHSNGKRESDESLRAVFASSSSSSSSVGAATAGMHGKSNGGFKAFWNNVVGRKTPPVSA